MMMMGGDYFEYLLAKILTRLTTPTIRYAASASS